MDRVGAGHHVPMTVGDQEFSPYEPPAGIVPEQPAPPTTRPSTSADTQPVAWLLWPARVIALGVVLPLRLVWEALRGAARAVGTALERALGLLGRALLAILRPAVAAVLAPLRWIGRALLLPLTTALAAALAWFADRLLLPLVRGLGSALRLVGRGATAVWAAVTGAVAAALRALGSAAAAGLAMVVRALGSVGRALGQVLRLVVLRPLEVLLGVVISAAGTLARALAVPFVLLWRWILRPVGTGLAVAVVALVMGLGRFLVKPLVRAIGAVLRGAGDVLAWAWHTAGRVLAFAGRVLAWPFVWVYRHVLTPVGHAIRAVWRAVVLAPWRAVRRTTSAAAAAVRASVRDARRQVGDQVRRALGRPPR